MKLSCTARAGLLTGIALACSASFALAQNNSPQHDISGYWELRFDSFSVPKASLTPAAASTADAQMRHDVDAIRWCNNLGVPYILGDHAPLDIRQSPSVTAMVAMAQSSARYIFSDGRKHPDKEDLDPTTNGHSIGRWDGDAFVVDTVGFNDRGVTRLPGGGVRTSDSHLIERYRLLDGGARLSASFTWDDAKVFQKPHTYEFRYYKVGPLSGSRILPCDQSDQERAKFLMAPYAAK